MKSARFHRTILKIVAVTWALFQLSLPCGIILDSITVRAIHLSFALLLVFLSIPAQKSRPDTPSGQKTAWFDYFLAGAGCCAALYLVWDWLGIAGRAGMPNMRDMVISIILIILVLEASRRVIGWALVIIVGLFTLYAFVGPYMPQLLTFRQVSLTKYLSKVVLSTEGIYGIPLDVSANTVFLFVLFGSLLEKAGAGKFFNDLSISLFGRFRGGPAKAAVVSSGLTGLVSGSSISNVVTTGTFTIPLMKKAGYPPTIAAATEVAASTNGQLMPPIMGAAAFIIAEYLGIAYMDVVKAAAIPALVSYGALFYITHLEALKRGMRGLDPNEIPAFKKVIRAGYAYLVPLVVLIYDMMVMRRTPTRSVFDAIIILVGIIIIRDVAAALRSKSSFCRALKGTVCTLMEGMIAGARNMLPVALATAAAGIVVGIVTMGIGSMIVQIVEIVSAGNIYLLLIITACASLVLGMGLPTTATYIVMASITVPIITSLGSGAGFVIPAIAAHLFCFYFGILADDTPPVGLAAYAAAAIAQSDPLATGIQGFLYDLRTAVIPFMFILNAELLLIGVFSLPQALLVFTMALLGACAFVNVVQGWYIIKNRWYEVPLFLTASLLLFHPGILETVCGVSHEQRYYAYPIGCCFYALAYALQKMREHRRSLQKT